MTLLMLAWKSLRNRWFSVLLCVLTIALSASILLGVEHIRAGARKSFQSTVSGTDLIVGARTGAVPLLLYTVFHIGEATNNVSYASYDRIRKMPQVAWSIPISLGDSYQGYRVVGTTTALFEHYKYGAKNALVFTDGRAFTDQSGAEAVVGAEVARKLKLQLGDQLSVAHGTGNIGILKHDHAKQQLVGVLKATGTPIDQSVFVSLPAIEDMHAGFDGSVRQAAHPRTSAASTTDTRSETSAPHDHHDDHDHDHDHAHRHAEPPHNHEHDSHPRGTADTATPAITPKAVTAFFLGLKNRPMALALQRQINDDRTEALLAILPTPTLQQLWRLMSVAERAIALIAAAVVLTGLIGMMMMLMATLEQRRREMAILRAVGAKPWHIFALLMLESAVLCLAGLLLAALLTTLLFALLNPLLAANGLYLDLNWISENTLKLVVATFAASLLLALVPAGLAWRRSLADGLSIKI